jgi:hypothetical protein
MRVIKSEPCQNLHLIRVQTFAEEARNQKRGQSTNPTDLEDGALCPILNGVLYSAALAQAATAVDDEVKQQTCD